MLSAVISDTVNLKSSTTTNVDKKAVIALAKIAKVQNIDKLALEIFKAKSNTSKLSDTELLKNDYKVFDFAGKKTFIGQIETVEQKEVISSRGPGLKKAMLDLQKELQLDIIFLAVSDILNVNTKLITIDSSIQIGEKAFKTQAVDGILDIGPKLSRKKEIAPAIEKIIQNG